MNRTINFQKGAKSAIDLKLGDGSVSSLKQVGEALAILTNIADNGPHEGTLTSKHPGGGTLCTYRAPGSIRVKYRELEKVIEVIEIEFN